MKLMKACLSRGRELSRDDSGMALAMVVTVTAILFLLATTLLTMVTYRETQTTGFIDRTKAMHLADAGINEYVYQLSRSYSFWKTSPHLAVQMQEGSWEVTASLAATGPLRLTSTGILPDGARRTINATVVFPTFAGYVFVLDKTDLTIGSGATITGKVWCNQDIDNGGIITGLASAVGNCTVGNNKPKSSNDPHYKGGYEDSKHYDSAAPTTLDFSQITSTLNDQRQAAIDAGTNFATSGALGYEVIFSGASAAVYKITAINYKVPYPGKSSIPLGQRTKSLVRSVIIPVTGVLYFDDDVWVSGDYAANVTLASSKNIYIPGNFAPTNPALNFTAGLVTPGYIYFPYWCDSVPSTHRVQCALLSQANMIGAQWTGGTGTGYAPTQTYSSRNGWQSAAITPAGKSLDYDGSFAMVKQQGFVMNEGSSNSQGYSSRSYSGDERLIMNPPPLYPQMPGGDLRVDTWLEK